MQNVVLIKICPLSTGVVSGIAEVSTEKALIAKRNTLHNSYHVQMFYCEKLFKVQRTFWRETREGLHCVCVLVELVLVRDWDHHAKTSVQIITMCGPHRQRQ